MSTAGRVSRGRVVFYVIAFVLCLGSIVYFSEIKEIAIHFRDVELFWLVCALLAQASTYLFAALAYRQAMNIGSFRIAFRPFELYRATIIAVFINQTIPSADISGNLFFVQLFRKKGATAQESLALLLLELISYFSAMLLLIFLVIFLVSIVPILPAELFPVVLAGMGAYLFFLVITVLVSRKGVIAALLRRLLRVKLFARFIKESDVAAYNEIEQETNPWILCKKHKRKFGVAILAQWAVVAADTATIVCLFKGLHIPLSTSAIFLGFLLTKIIALLPLSPGALLVYEGGMTFFYSLFGAPLHVALIVTLLYRGLSFWLPMPIGLLLYKNFLKKDDNILSTTQIV